MHAVRIKCNWRKTSPTKSASTLRRAVRSQAFAQFKGVRTLFKGVRTFHVPAISIVSEWRLVPQQG